MILERLRPLLAEVRPTFIAARSYQLTTYRPGGLMHLDWWETGIEIPAARGAARAASGLVATPYVFLAPRGK